MTDFSMQGQAEALLAQIRHNRLIQVPVAWEDELVFAYYQGLSLPNVTHSIAQALGVELPKPAPLDTAIWGEASPLSQVRRVVSFLFDGVGYLYLQSAMAQDAEVRQLVADLTQGRGALPLTSVTPSTTAAALTSLWTGASPAATGMLGTTLYIRQLSMIGDMLAFGPQIGAHGMDRFTQWGLDPKRFVPVPTLPEVLAQHAIPTYSVIHKYLTQGGLSSLLHRQIAQTYSHCGSVDMPLRVSDALKATRGQAAYIAIYWDAFDAIAHHYGIDTPYTHAELKAQLRALRAVLEDEAVRDGQTLVLLLADHGHAPAPQALVLGQDERLAGLQQALVLGLTGDNRLSYAHLRDGERFSAMHSLDAVSDSIGYLHSGAALAAGVFGRDSLAPDTESRIGNLTLIPRQGWIIQDASVSQYPLKSWHAGLSAHEMLVPLLWQVI